MLTNSAGILIISSYKFMDVKIGGLDSFTEAVCIAICIILVGIMIYQSFHMYMLNIDEKKLEAAYIKSKDERNIMIREKTSGASYTISIYMLCAGVIVSSFFSQGICIAFACVIIAMLLVNACCKLYYERKY